MRVGVFTPLLSQLPLPAVLKKLKTYNIDTVELGTGNYPGDAHCKLTMLDDHAALAEFQKILKDHGVTISALSCHGNAAASRSGAREAGPRSQPQDDPAGRKARRPRGRRFLRMPRRLATRHRSQLGHLPVAARLPQGSRLAMERSGHALLARARQVRRRSRREDRHRNAPRLRRLQPGDDAQAARHRRPQRRLQLRPEPHVLAEHRPHRRHPRAGDAIFHVHAKDTQIYAANLPRTGVLDTKPYTDERNRGWIFRTCGYGHGAEWWKEFVSTLRMFGYDYVLSIEHEDSLLSPEEGLAKAASFLERSCD